MIDVIQNLGYEIKSHMSPVNDEMLRDVLDYFEGQKAEAIAEEARKKEVAEKRKAIEKAEKEAAKAEKEAATERRKAEKKKREPEEARLRRKLDDEAARRVAEKLIRVKSETERIRRQAAEAKRLAEETVAAADPLAVGEKVEAVEPETLPVEEEVAAITAGAEIEEAVEGEEVGIAEGGLGEEISSKTGRLSGASLRERIRLSKEAREAEGVGPKIIERRAPQVKERRPPAPRPAPRGSPRKKKRKKGRKAVDAEEVKSTIRETLADIRSGPGRSKARRRRREAGDEEVESAELEERKVIQITEFASVAELASQMEVTPSDIIAVCLQLGLVVTINQRLEMETIEFIADEFGYGVESIEEYGADIFEEIEIEVDEEKLVGRAPVVTVMGHVDHGKTSLLDYIRQTKVVAGEVGGITQHIGAYEIETPGGKLVVAINKIDLPEADPEGVKQQLTQHNVVVEDYGGDTVAVPVSAKNGDGVDKLLEMILIQAEMLELKADRTGLARGIVLEAELDKGRGPVATVLVQKGELKEGDPFLAGMHSGRARALFDPRGRPRRDVHPSQAVQVLGFDGLPQPGDSFHTVADEKEARALSQKRQQIRREQEFAVRESTILSEVRAKIEEGEIEELPLIVKGDTDGSVEALSDSFHKLSTDEVQVRVIHQGVGGINETDVMLAHASNAIVVGFHVRPDRNAREVADQTGVEIRLYEVIYEAVDEIKQGLEGLLKPEIKEEIVGTLEIRDTFRIPRVGSVAGCMVVDGVVKRSSMVRLIRDGVNVYDGKVGSLRRFKDDVPEVREGFECGVGLENFNDIKVGDIIEVYEREEVARTL